MHFAADGQQPIGRAIRDDEIGKAPCLAVRHRADPVSGDNVGVRLVDDERIGVRGAHPRQQAEIGAHLAGAEADRQIVLDLPRHQDAATIRRDAGDRVRRSPDARLYLVMPRSTSRVSEPLGAGEKVGRKVAVAQQAFEIAAAARVEIHPARIEHQRGRRQEVGAEPDRADEPVLDADQRHAGRAAASAKPCRQTRGPARDRAASPAPRCARAASSAPAIVRRNTGTPADERRKSAMRRRFQNDIPTHTAMRRFAVSIRRHSARIASASSKAGRGIAERIAVARRDEADTGEDLVDRAAEAVQRHRGGVVGDTPAGIVRGGEGGHRHTGQQRRESRSRRRCCRRDRRDRAATRDRMRAR